MTVNPSVLPSLIADRLEIPIYRAHQHSPILRLGDYLAQISHDTTSDRTQITVLHASGRQLTALVPVRPDDDTDIHAGRVADEIRALTERDQAPHNRIPRPGQLRHLTDQTLRSLFEEIRTVLARRTLAHVEAATRATYAELRPRPRRAAWIVYTASDHDGMVTWSRHVTAEHRTGDATLVHLNSRDLRELLNTHALYTRPTIGATLTIRL